MTNQGAKAELSRRGFLGATGVTGLGLALTLSGCASSPGGAASSGSSTGAGSKSVDFNNKSLEIFFYQVLFQALTRATKATGYSLSSTNANNDASAQFNNWRSSMLQGPAFLISNPVDSANLIPLTTQAKGKKIPVGVIDTPLTGGVVDFTIAFNNRQGGVLAAEETVAALRKKYGTERGIVLNAYGTLQSSALRDRRDGFNETILKYPNIKLLSRPTEESEEKTRSLVTATLAQYEKLDAIHTPTDSLTRPARISMKSAGRLVPIGDDRHVILTSIDGGPDSLTWLSERTLDAEIAQDPVAYGQICVEMLAKYSLKGQAVPLGDYENKDYFWEKAKVIQGAAGPQMVLPAYSITAANAADDRQWGNIVTKKWSMKES